MQKIANNVVSLQCKRWIKMPLFCRVMPFAYFEKKNIVVYLVCVGSI
jgi:hypothetical protein